MNSRPMVVAVLLMSLASSEPLSQTDERRHENSGELRLELAATRLPTGRTGLKITVLNYSSRAYWINRRMLWNPGDSTQLREVDLDIHGPDGRRIAFGCKIRAFRAGGFDYVVVRQGDIVGAIVDLDCAHLKAGHRYRIGARYKDGSAPNGSLQGIPYFRGELVAAPIHLIF